MTMLISGCIMIFFWVMSFLFFVSFAPNNRAFASLQYKKLEVVPSAALGLLFLCSGIFQNKTT